MRPALLLLLGLLGCKADKGEVTPSTGALPSTGTATGTGTGSPTTAVGNASCALDPDNALRVWCTAELDTAGNATAHFFADGVPSHDFASTEPGTTVEIFAWGLKPETRYSWTIGDASGSVTTGVLPEAIASATIDVSGSITGFDAVLLPMNCGGTWFAMIDQDGDIVWYEDNDLYQNGMDGYEWSQADRSLLIGNGGTVVEISVTGDTLLTLGGYSGDAHHDLARWGQYTYVLHDYSYNNYNVDGIHVFDGTTLLGTFHLEDHFAIIGGGGGGPGGADWAHSNGINPTDDGHLILSLLAFDTVLSIDMDPASPSFLEIAWIAEGNAGNGLPGADYSPPAGANEGFGGQHNASFSGDRLYLFDNDGDGQESRATRFRLDDATGEVVFEEGWGVGARCPIEGGSIPVGGGVLASCVATRDVFLFANGSSIPDFELNAKCITQPGGGNEPMNRGIPVVIE